MTDRLLFLHGFTQTSACWGPLPNLVGPALGSSVLLVDLPGHGSGGRARSLWETAELFAAHLEGTSGGNGEGTPASGQPAVDLIGYSLGGRTALHLALAHPALVRSLVLLGATAGISDPTLRAERHAADEERAGSIERDGVDEFLAEWTAMDMFAGIPPELRCLDARRSNTAAGLAGSLRLAGTGAQDDLWPRLGEITCPTLVLAGELDEKFCEIGRRLSAAIPGGDFQTVPGAGHAAHLERPEATAALIATWLRTIRSG